jgi:hypothetical protein
MRVRINTSRPGLKDSIGVAVLALALAVGPIAHTAQPVLQRGYDAGVSGANLTEVTLNTSNVSPATFGLVFKLPVDDVIFAQPLYVPNVAVPSLGTHNVVYIATMSDTLFAFDADSGVQLWVVNFASSVGAVPVKYAKFAFAGNRNIVGNLGILSTPVIDPSTNILYLVACTLENSTMVYRLHAVNSVTGAELIVAGGTVVSAIYKGSTFVATGQTQRMSLTLSGNQVVFGFGAMESEGSNSVGYVGWVMAYDKTTLVQSGAFATVTSGSWGGGVWQSGRPAAVDSSGYVYEFVGNGYTSGYDGVNNFGETALKLDPAAGLILLDWFTPGNWRAMDAGDLDLSSSGPMLIPGTGLLAGGGKTGVLYVLNTANLGKESATDSGAVQKETISAGSIRGGPVYWQRSAANGGPLLYDWGNSDWVKAYPFSGTTLAATPSSQGSGAQISPGGILALSANGDTSGSGVLWATVAISGDAQSNPPVPGALYAFDANNVATKLWDSTTNSTRDNVGLFAKFVPPLVVNGKVYVATWSDQVAVYGLLSTYTLSPTSMAFGNQLTNIASAPKSVTLTNTGTVALPIASITLSTPSPQPFSQTNTCGTSVAVGATCTINVVFNPTSAGSTMATLSVNVAGKTSTVIVSGNGSFNVILKASSQSVTVSMPVTLTWSSTTGAACTPSGGTTADNWTGTVGASGSHLVTEASAGTYDYGLICVAQAVSATATVTVAMTLPAVSLTAAPTAITVGKPVALTWTSSNAPACAASGGQSGDGWTGARSANGTASVTPNAAETIMYVMTCSSGPKSAKSVAQVVATSPPGSSGGGGALDEFSLLCILALIGLHTSRSGTRRAIDTCPSIHANLRKAGVRTAPDSVVEVAKRKAGYPWISWILSQVRYC